MGALAGDAEAGGGIADGKALLVNGRRDAPATLDGLTFPGRGPLADLPDLGEFRPRSSRAESDARRLGFRRRTPVLRPGHIPIPTCEDLLCRAKIGRGCDVRRCLRRAAAAGSLAGVRCRVLDRRAPGGRWVGVVRNAPKTYG